MKLDVSNILIISTGGTFNKIYNPIKGVLEVDSGRVALEDMAKRWGVKFNFKSIIQKDSLDMNEQDRRELLESIKESNSRKILIIHGTDTMDLSANYLSKSLKNRSIVFTGAMKPYSIDSVEASLNLALSLGFLLSIDKDGVFISMGGKIAPFNLIRKNRSLGRFEFI